MIHLEEVYATLTAAAMPCTSNEGWHRAARKAARDLKAGDTRAAVLFVARWGVK
jgi:hypothetical protein